MASTDAQLTNFITFPTRTLHDESADLPVVSARATALDVCYSVYGEGPVPVEAIESYYEANALYENPFVTATSRSVIGDIHRLSRQLSAVDVPRPLAMICILFRLRPPRSEDVFFQGMRAWTDILDVCENESFDGHRKAIVEHTLNILLLPGLHCEGTTSHRIRPNGSLVDMEDPFYSPTFSHPRNFTTPSLPIPGTSLSFPSPFHFKLRVVTRLSFNEQGLVTHHRDIWDIKDVMGLLPGVSLAQWIGTRVAAAGLSSISKIFSSQALFSDSPPTQTSDEEQGKVH